MVEYERTVHAFLSFAGALDVAREAIARIATTVAGRRRPSPPRLQHVALPYAAGRAEQARAFYGDIVGLAEKPVPRAFRDRDFVWFAAGPLQAELHLIPETGIDMGSERHVCLAVDDLDRIVARLRAAGHPVEEHAEVINRCQAFVRDPFTNLIELTEIRGPYG